MKYSIGRLECAILQNKSGTSLAQGDVCIIDTSNIKAITTTTTDGYSSGRVGVVVETSGIAVDGWGLVAFSGVAPKVNLASSASIGDMIKTHTVAKQATPHASPFLVGDFAQVLETGTSPSCILFGSVVDVTGSGTYLTPSGLTGATQTSRWVGSTTAGAPVTGTFQVGDWVIDQTGVLWVCSVAGSPGTWIDTSAGSGSYVFLREEVASASALLSFTSQISNTYDMYEFRIEELIPATNAVDLYAQFSSDNGSTWVTSNLYAFSGYAYSSAGSTFYGIALGAPTSSFKFRNTNPISNDTNYGVNGIVRLHNPKGSKYKKIDFDLHWAATSGVMDNVLGSGVLQSTTAMDAIKFYFSSGNITSGKIRMYGVKSS